VSTPLVVKPVPAAIPRQLVFSNLMESSTTTNNNSNIDKDRRKSAPVGALKVSALSQPGSDGVALLEHLKLKEALNEKKVEGLMYDLDQVNIENEALRKRNHELANYGYQQYETQEENGATNDEDEDEDEDGALGKTQEGSSASTPEELWAIDTLLTQLSNLPPSTRWNYPDCVLKVIEEVIDDNYSLMTIICLAALKKIK
jgi:hypothetical protein